MGEGEEEEEPRNVPIFAGGRKKKHSIPTKKVVAEQGEKYDKKCLLLLPLRKRKIAYPLLHPQRGEKGG